MKSPTLRINRAPFLAALCASGVMWNVHAAIQRGVVTLVTVSPPAARAGTPVTASVTGQNPCGAVHIDWGDGTALTYPIVDLTTTQSHTYERAGNYTITARGMGNCDGQATRNVRIDPAPAPPTPVQAEQQMSAFTVSIPAPVGSPVGVTAHGRGTCRFTVDFGDGTSQTFTVPLPHTVRHVYDAPGTYTVAATARRPCEGQHSVKLNVGAAEPTAQLLGMRIAPNPSAARTRIAITIDGRGTCPVTVDFGDGNDQTLKVPLPAEIGHTYARAGLYKLFAWTEAPCTGEATGSVRVRPNRR